MWFSLLQIFQPTSPYNPNQALCFQRKFIWTQVYLNTCFCFLLRNTLWTVHQINHQINLIFTAPYPSLVRASIHIPSPYLVPPPWFHFPNHIPISHTPQLTTHATYIPSIYGVRMPSQHSKPARIHNNTIFKFILRHHYDKEISTFRWDS